MYDLRRAVSSAGAAASTPSTPMHAPTRHPTLPAASPAVLWREYVRSGDVRLRDRLVFTLAPLVRHAGAQLEQDVTAGLCALLAAVDGYAPGRDGTLEHFAWTRVCAALDR